LNTTNDLNKAIVELGNLRGGYLWRQNTGVRMGGGGRPITFGHKGSGDVIGCYKGFFVSIETKVGKDKASEDQIAFAQQITERGGFAIFASSLEDADALFDKIDMVVNAQEYARRAAGNVYQIASQV
jgi:hypothetical protein